MDITTAMTCELTIVSITGAITCELTVMDRTSAIICESTVRDLSSWISDKPTVLSKVMDITGVITYGSTVILHQKNH